MKIAFIMVAVLALVFVSPLFSAEDATSAKASGANFEQKKADRIKRLDERIARIQGERSCIQMATSRADLKTCREKFKSERASNRPEKKECR